ncbi:MAG: universal stress protein [Deltaproteobacteria bacterium]
MIKQILVPQDGSTNAQSAVDYSLWLAGRFGAGITGLHVVDIVSLEGPFLHDLSGSLGFEPFLNFSAKMRETLEARGRTILSAFDLRCEGTSINHSTQLAYGVVAREICEKAQLADLVVIGRRGINEKFEYGLLGSTTESVIRKSPKPVLIVPPVFNEPKRPLLAFDGSPNSCKAMHSAAEWAKSLALDLAVVVVSQRDEENALIADAQDYLGRYEIKASYSHIKDEPPIGIERFYKENGHDLIFMGASHHSKIVEMVLGSTTEHVMRNIDGPLLLER